MTSGYSIEYYGYVAKRGPIADRLRQFAYSHSMVPGGFEVMS